MSSPTCGPGMRESAGSSTSTRSSLLGIGPGQAGLVVVCAHAARATRTVPVLCKYVGELSVAGPLRRNPRWHRVFERCDEPPSASRATCCRHAGGEQRHTHPVSWGRPSVSRHSRKRGGLQADKGGAGQASGRYSSRRRRRCCAPIEGASPASAEHDGYLSLAQRGSPSEGRGETGVEDGFAQKPQDLPGDFPAQLCGRQNRPVVP